MLAYSPSAISVSGNGSPAVMVDNYLYFVDVYVDKENIEYKQNDYYYKGEMPKGGIYRVKLINGLPEYVYDNYNYELDDGTEYNDIEDDLEYYNKTVKRTLNIEEVVPKIAGHSAVALWVYNDKDYGNILIYSSPNNLNNKTGVLQKNKLDFFRVELNGDNNTKIYTAETDNLSRDSFSVVWTDGSVYLTVNDGGTLKRVSMSGKKKDITEIAAEVSNVVFPKVTNYQKNGVNNSLQKSFEGVMQYVYYTLKRDDDHTDNKMYRYNFASNSGNGEPIASNVGIDNGKTYTPKLLSGGRFLFTVKGSGTNDITEIYLSSKVTDRYSNLSTVQSTVSGDENSLVVGSAVAGDFPKFEDLKFYLPTEMMGKIDTNPNGTAKVLVVYNSKLYSCGVVGENIIFGGSIRNSVDEVVLATKDKIYTKSGSSINICNYTGTNQGGVASVDTQNANIPLSIIQPCDKNGASVGSNTSLVYMLTDSGLFLLDRNGTQYEIAIKDKNNRPVAEEEPVEEIDDGTYTEEYPIY
jgi:hypothetical protein